MAKFGPTYMGDPHVDPQTTPIHMDLVPFSKRKRYKESMWIGVLWAGVRVAMWITHVGGPYFAMAR